MAKLEMGADIETLASQVGDAREELYRIPRRASRRAAMICADYARALAPGSIKDAITVEYNGEKDCYEVVVRHPGAVFVEFGTGIGAASNEPFDVDAMADAGYVVNASGKGEEGWAYFDHEEIRGEDKVKVFGFTHGQKGRGYLAKGVNRALDEVDDIMKAEVKVVMHD